MQSQPRRFSQNDLHLRILSQHPVVKQYKAKLQVVRMIMVGAAPLSREVNQQLFQLLPDAHIGQSYGTCLLLQSVCLRRQIFRHDRDLYSDILMASYS